MVQQNSVKLEVWTMFGKNYREKKFRKIFRTYHQLPNGLASVVDGTSVPLVVI